MKKTILKISKMDCPSEERIIRMRLDEISGIKNLDFNIPERELSIIHEGSPEELLEILRPLNFGASISSSEESDTFDLESSSFRDLDESHLLKKLFAINAGMFLVELIFGLIAESIGLISDSFDMLADSGVYLISLYAVGKSIQMKKKSALTNGIFQIVIGVGILLETLRRFIYGSDPEPSYMIAVSLMALIANVYCLVLLSKHKNGEVHLKASYICSSTDVMANTGVIIAGALVFLLNSAYPDLVIGLVVTGIVMKGAISILQLAK